MDGCGVHIGLANEQVAHEMRLLALRGLPEVRPGDDLCELLANALSQNGLSLETGDVLVLAQKIVSKSENCFVDVSALTPSAEAQALASETGKCPYQLEAVLQQSRNVLRKRPGVVVVEDKRGFILANAGLDASNTGQQGDAVLALPDEPDQSAHRLRVGLELETGARIGVIINDSWGRPFRLGTVGMAIGSSGIAALDDRCGNVDRDGRELQATHVAIADELAAAASVLMGAGAEGQPVVLIKGAPIRLSSGVAKDLIRPVEQDLFREGPK